MKTSSTLTQRPCVLIADDNEGTREMLSECLTYWGYEAIVASDGEMALALAAARPLTLALLDVRMPGPSGMKLAGRLKEFQPEMEVIVITAYGSVPEAVEAMYQGAFYYLLKPLDLELLREKVDRARAVHQERTLVRVGELFIDLREGRVTLGGKAARLTSLECQILVCLAQRRGQVVNHKVLSQEAWGCESGVESNAIWIALHRLRAKIGTDYISCFKGRGYLLQAPEPASEGAGIVRKP